MLAKINKKPTDWQKITQNKSVMVLPLLTVLFIGVMLLVVVIPTIKSIGESRRDLEQEKERLERLTAKREALEALSMEQMREELIIVNRVLPSRKPIVPIIGALAGVATESAITLTSYDFSPGAVASDEAKVEVVENPGMLSFLPVAVSFNGVYEDVVNYIRKIQVVSPLMRYLTAGLSGELAQTEKPPFGSELEITAYYALPPAKKGGIEDPLPPMSPRKEEILAQAASYPDYDIFSAELDSTVELNKPNPFTF